MVAHPALYLDLPTLFVEFRGFHIRFRDVARGGVRLVQSRYPQAYNQNVINLFDECYNLVRVWEDGVAPRNVSFLFIYVSLPYTPSQASTQQRKNKDIPEGGSKGVILLGLDHQSKGEVAFRKYVDSLLDLLLPEKRAMVDHYGDQEFIFLGPDEGTAEFMDWYVQRH